MCDAIGEHVSDLYRDGRHTESLLHLEREIPREMGILSHWNLEQTTKKDQNRKISIKAKGRPNEIEGQDWKELPCSPTPIHDT